MFARATLSVGQIAKALLVPKDAIVLGGPTPMVFVADAAQAKGRKREGTPRLRAARRRLGRISASEG